MDKAVIPAVINGKITYFQTVNNSDLGFVFQYFGANVSLAQTAQGLEISVNNWCLAQYRVDVLNETEAKYAKYMPKEEKISLKDFLVSPMAGSLLSVAVTEGQVVSYCDIIILVYHGSHYFWRMWFAWCSSLLYPLSLFEYRVINIIIVISSALIIA